MDINLLHYSPDICHRFALRMRRGRPDPSPIVSELGAPAANISPASGSNLDTTSFASLDRAGLGSGVTNIHVSQSHTNLLLMDSTSDISELVGEEKSQTRRKPNLSVLLDPSLMAVLGEFSGLPLSSVDNQLQAIKAVLDNYCGKYTGEWDKILEER